MSLIEEILEETVDTKACVHGPGVIGRVAELFRQLFPEARRAIVIDDVNTRRVAGEKVIALLKDAGIETAEYTINPDGSWFHATYDKVEEVREAIRSESTNRRIDEFSHSRRRRFGNHQRSCQAFERGARPQVHGRRHRRLDGRLHL